MVEGDGGSPVEGGGDWPVDAPAVEPIGTEGRTSGAVERIGDGAAAVVARGSDGLGGGDDMVETKLADTRLVETRVLPGLGRRL